MAAARTGARGRTAAPATDAEAAAAAEAEDEPLSVPLVGEFAGLMEDDVSRIWAIRMGTIQRFALDLIPFRRAGYGVPRRTNLVL